MSVQRSIAVAAKIILNGNGICTRNCHCPIIFLHLWILFLGYTYMTIYICLHYIHYTYVHLQYIHLHPLPLDLASSISHLPRLSLTGLKELRDTAGAGHRPSVGAETSRRNGGYAVMRLTTAVVLGQVFHQYKTWKHIETPSLVSFLSFQSAFHLPVSWEFKPNDAQPQGSAQK